MGTTENRKFCVHMTIVNEVLFVFLGMCVHAAAEAAAPSAAADAHAASRNVKGSRHGKLLGGARLLPRMC